MSPLVGAAAAEAFCDNIMMHPQAVADAAAAEPADAERWQPARENRQVRLVPSARASAVSWLPAPLASACLNSELSF